MASSTSATTASTAISPSAATRPRSCSRATTPTSSKKITYRELHEKVCKLANVLKGMGVKKGDRVTIYLPMIPEAAYAMLACARIGAPHSVVFGGFSPDSLADRVNDAKSKLIITSDGGLRGGRAVPLKVNADKALEKCPPDVKVLMFRHTGMSVPMVEGRDLDAGELMKTASADCPPEPMNAEDPLFLLYTSGSTGKPKGALHTTGGYLVYAALTHEYVFDYREGDVYWCTADVGWVTGPQLHPLRPARQRRHDPDVRGHPDLPQHLAVLGRRRQAPGHHLLHRAHRDPLADAEGRRAGAGRPRASRCACWARSASRSTPRSGSGTTASSATAAARSSTPGGRPRPAAS